MRFYKYHGAGNDFVLVDNLDEKIPEEEKSRLAKIFCDRKFGVGGDGLVLVEKSGKADIKMRIFNPDGTEPGMCGNAIRCFAKHVYDKGIIKKGEILIETSAGVKKVKVTVEGGRVTYVRVEMGKPKFERAKIPAKGSGALLNQKIKVEGKELEISAVNTGVPHAVIFVDDVDQADVLGVGMAIRYNELFPKGTNVNFLQKIGDNAFKVRTYERGVEGETLACGTGIAACGAISAVLGKVDVAKRIEFKAKGGTIYIEVEGKGEEITIYMNGPATFVFEGNINIM
jgi:diaminopimelate epimerase